MSTEYIPSCQLVDVLIVWYIRLPNDDMEKYDVMVWYNKELFENAPPYMIFRPFLKGGLHMSSGQISKLIQINYGTNVLIFMCSFWQNYMNIMTNLYHIHLHLSSQIHMDMGTNMNNTSDKYTQRFQQIHRNIMTTLIDTSVKYTWRWQ